MLKPNINLASLTEEPCLEDTAYMTKQIPKKVLKKGDIVHVGEKQFLVTEVHDGAVSAAKRVQTICIQFNPDDDVTERQKLIRDTMKDRLPIELINVTLKVDGLETYYGYDQDLRHADSITLIYTK